MHNLEAHAYLAGPDVFFPDARTIGQRKKEALARVGIEGHFPFDNELPKEAFKDPKKAANLIAEANERMMLDCCKEGRIGIILANMTPFHGPSMDVGTSFEVGFMSALAATKPNVIVIGYTDDPRLFEVRVRDDVYGGKQNVREKDGALIGPDGRTIEAFGCAENLMIVHAIE
jgi:nucleoside 2-deoxyribosyltransferase